MIGRTARAQSLLNAYWVPINFEASALMTIAVPAALLRFPGNHTALLAALASVTAAIAMLVPPVAGAISDRLRRAGGKRRPIILAGALANALALVWLALASTPSSFIVALLIVTAAQSVSVAAYSALIPELVAPSDWGASSGYQGAASIVGSIAGLAVAGLTSPSVTFVWTAVVVAGGALSVLAVPEDRWQEPEHAHVRNWRNFGFAFLSRFWTIFGLTLLMTFVLYFFNDVLKVSNPAAGTGLMGGIALLGAVVSSIWMGHLSDRIPRKYIVALAGVPMAITAIGFALLPDLRFILGFALLFGFGHGAFLSTGWALGIDSVPQLRNVARDLGLWGVASNLPGVLAPAIGGYLLARFAMPAEGYRALFIAAGACFILGSITVLWIGQRLPQKL